MNISLKNKNGVTPIIGVMLILSVLVLILLFTRSEIVFITSVVFDPSIREDASQDIEFLGIEGGELFLGVNKNRNTYTLQSITLNDEECLLSDEDLIFGVNQVPLNSSCIIGDTFTLRYNINDQEIIAVSQEPSSIAIQRLDPTSDQLALISNEIINISYQIGCFEENCGEIENSIQVTGTAISDIIGDSTLNCTLSLSESCVVTFQANVSSLGSSTVEFTSNSSSLNVVRFADDLIVNFVSRVGEAGTISLQNRESRLINLTHTYSSTPVIIAIPATQNNDESAYVPIIHSINTTQVNISLCRDNGANTCDDSYNVEEVHYMVFDPAIADNYLWIDVGKINITTDGNPNTFSFSPSASFSSTPYVFGLPQTYNISTIVTNGISAHSWFTTITTAGADIVGCDHPGTADSCAGTAVEEFGYVAIDTTNENFSKFNSGFESIEDSTWTSITYADSFTNPIISVMMNSENGAEDPAYPWARNIISSGAEIRYCEQEGANSCDNHAGEDTMWMVFEEGFIDIN